jgi:hypothetical protein
VESEIDVNRAKVQELLAKADRLYSESDKLTQEKFLLRKKQGLVAQQERLAFEQVLQVKKEVKRIAADTALKKVQGEKAGKEMAYLQKQIRKLRFALSELEKIANVYKGPVGGTIVYIREIMRALGLGPIAAAITTKGGKR